MSTPDKIPVILVTGFLGSGKTTLLRHLAQTHPNWRMVFLVNELSTCEANPFSTREIAWPQQRGIAEVRAWLADLPASILRVKGRIRTPEGCWHIERSVDGLDITPALENIPAAETDSGGTLVLIAHDADQADLDRGGFTILSLPLAEIAED